jgi:hypothetical protein
MFSVIEPAPWSGGRGLPGGSLPTHPREEVRDAQGRPPFRGRPPQVEEVAQEASGLFELPLHGLQDRARDLLAPVAGVPRSRLRPRSLQRQLRASPSSSQDSGWGSLRCSSTTSAQSEMQPLRSVVFVTCDGGPPSCLLLWRLARGLKTLLPAGSARMGRYPPCSRGELVQAVTQITKPR